MTPAEYLSGPRMKADRAKFHIENLKAAVAAFQATNPYHLGTKNDPDTGKLQYYMTRVDEVPAHVSAIIGDALCNLRAALDHFAQQLYLFGTSGSAGLSADISYPIFDDAAKYAAGSPGKVKGIRQDAIDFIGATKPYKGGNDALWRIHKLNNIDKHRVLIGVGAGNYASDIGADASQRFNRAFGGKGYGPMNFSAFFRMADLMCPLKVGDVLFTGAVGDKPNEKMGFTFVVSLNEPAILPAESVAVTLTDFANVVDGILNSAGPLFV